MPTPQVIPNTRMVLEIHPCSIAARTPIVPTDQLYVKSSPTGYKCFVIYDGEKKRHFAGKVEPSFGSNLDEKMRGKTWFQAVARTQGNGVEIPLVAVKSLCRRCGKAMPPISTSRVNGADHSDWMTRDYHKSCWKA